MARWEFDIGMIIVGCCGWAVKGGMRGYYRRFGAIEVQQTFYRLPKVETMERWRRESPINFAFTLKAWQVITHPSTSPTWGKVRMSIGGKLGNYGYLRSTNENISAWYKVLEVYRALRADACILQCPPSFEPSPENVTNAKRFFKLIDKEGTRIGLELRGQWNDKPGLVADICEEFDLIHVVDPFRWKCVSKPGLAYFRLHGIGGGDVNYSYKYSHKDLMDLGRYVSETRAEKAYVFFNNMSMAQDASRFKRVIEGPSSSDADDI